MHKNRLSLTLFTLLLFFIINPSGFQIVKAQETDTATLRILATGDLHGQVTAYNCETGAQVPDHGLSKLSTIIQKQRNEAGVDNTLLVDAGDFLYDYTSNYFYDNYSSMTQPIMKAMAAMNYDYITMGNHDFDYPWDYINRQLTVSGLSDKVLVCNTVWHDTGKQVFSPSAIVTKSLKTAAGNTVNVKVGIIGATTNSVSTRRGDYVNVIDAVNNYDSIVTEADRLKNKEGVDLVVVIVHGGIGNGVIDSSSENIAYALTKVDSIDAVVTGHTHELFPDAKSTAATLSNVNIQTGCINGKPVVATSSHAAALGTIDLTFGVESDGSVTLSSGKSRITLATKDTKEDSTITTLFDDYLQKLKAGADTASYKIASGITYHNYDTVVQDSNLYQLLNNAKIDYGLTYISENLPAYKNIPVIACTRNLLDNCQPYLYLKDTLTAGKISQILSESSAARPAGYIQMYEITGKALREWLEYNASIYAVSGTVFNNLLKTYTGSHPGQSTLLQDNYVYNWNTQYIFDGVTFSIDLTKKARYTPAGKLISTTNKRITGLTYNGVTITDTQKFVIVTDTGIPDLSFLPEDIYDSIKEIKDYETGKDITMNYIKKLSVFGSIPITADHNWSLTAGQSYTFLLGVPTKYAATISAFSWNKGFAAATATYSFYQGKLPAAAQKINIIVTQGRTEVNNKPVPVMISATSRYAISEIKYLPGKITSSTDTKWYKAKAVLNNTFTTQTNGVYTILAKDAKGNRSIAYVTVNLYNATKLPSPKLNRLTNRNSTITGTAEPNSTLHISIGNNSYTAVVPASGAFTINIQPPKAFVAITAYCEANGKKSATVSGIVRKSGPNAVQLNTIHVGDTNATGTTSPNTLVYALIWKTIYVGKGQTNAYKTSEFYKSDYNIVETDITMDQATGAFKISLPVLKSNMNVFVFATDRFGITSKSTMLTPVNY